MNVPPEFDTPYWHLWKGLYGLWQARCQWYLTLHDAYIKLNYKHCHSDWSVYTHIHGKNVTISATSVDDILLATDSVLASDAATAELNTKFTITNGATPNGFLDAKLQGGTTSTFSNSTKNNSWFAYCTNSRWSFATPPSCCAQSGASCPICAPSLKRENRSPLHSPTVQSLANVCTSLHALALTFHMPSVNWHTSCLTTVWRMSFRCHKASPLVPPRDLLPGYCLW